MESHQNDPDLQDFPHKWLFTAVMSGSPWNWKYGSTSEWSGSARLSHKWHKRLLCPDLPNTEESSTSEWSGSARLYINGYSWLLCPDLPKIWGYDDPDLPDSLNKWLLTAVVSGWLGRNLGLLQSCQQFILLLKRFSKINFRF